MTNAAMTILSFKAFLPKIRTIFVIEIGNIAGYDDFLEITALLRWIGGCIGVEKTAKAPYSVRKNAKSGGFLRFLVVFRCFFAWKIPNY